MNEDKQIAHIALGSSVLSVALLIFIIFLLTRHTRVIENCSTLTYVQAQKELSIHPRLDRNHDGIACQENGH